MYSLPMLTIPQWLQVNHSMPSRMLPMLIVKLDNSDRKPFLKPLTSRGSTSLYFEFSQCTWSLSTAVSCLLIALLSMDSVAQQWFPEISEKIHLGPDDAAQIRTYDLMKTRSSLCLGDLRLKACVVLLYIHLDFCHGCRVCALH